MKNIFTKSLAVGMVILFSFVSAVSVQGGLTPDLEANKININTASQAELQKLPRIGEVVAQRIIEFREKNGKFKKIEELMKVRGIGEKTFDNLKDLITVGPEK
ncbi:MAG TPA: helix-hairpin-helix domain-containing protein [Acidobacteriota bacterium]|nr:helix-hairpin-helix domain-containing protein [Acidobacteriota bacterium]